MASQSSYPLGFSVREILLLKQRMPHFWEVVFYGLCSLFLFICFILFFHCIEHLFSVRKLVQFSLNIKLATLALWQKWCHTTFMHSILLWPFFCIVLSIPNIQFCYIFYIQIYYVLMFLMLYISFLIFYILSIKMSQFLILHYNFSHFKYHNSIEGTFIFSLILICFSVSICNLLGFYVLFISFYFPFKLYFV